MDTLRRFPVIPAFLIFVACIGFEYRTPSSQLSVPGLVGGLAVLGIVAVVLSHRIFKHFENVCREKGWLTVPVQHRYDILFPIAFVAASLKWQYLGPEIVDTLGKAVPQWEIAWSDPTLDVYFVLAMFVVVVLLRVNDFVHAIARSARADG